MAQLIKKFDKGGSTNTSKRGTFTIDNVTYEIDDNNLAKLYEHAKTLDDRDSGAMRVIIDSLLSGNNLTYDSTGAGKLSGAELQFNVTKNQKERLKHERNNFGTVAGDIWHGKEERVRRAISSLKNLRLNENKAPVGTTYYIDKEISGQYTEDKDKKRTIEDPTLLGKIKRRIDLVKNIPTYLPEDTIIVYDGMTKDEYINFLNTHNKDAALDTLMTALENGN